MTDAFCWCCGQDFDSGQHYPDPFLAQLVAAELGTDRGPLCGTCEQDFMNWYSSKTVD